MNVISQSKIINEKIKTIQSGYTAFSETEEILDRLKKELNAKGIEYIEETSKLGSWIIPKKEA